MEGDNMTTQIVIDDSIEPNIGLVIAETDRVVMEGE